MVRRRYARSPNFFAALARIARFRIDEAELVLLDDAGAELLRLVSRL